MKEFLTVSQNELLEESLEFLKHSMGSAKNIFENLRNIRVIVSEGFSGASKNLHQDSLKADKSKKVTVETILIKIDTSKILHKKVKCLENCFKTVIRTLKRDLLLH